jgi:formamidopyrimidine-DNA glycosylase
VPELPEVESVRRGLADHVRGWQVLRARAHHPRVARRHVGGGADLCQRLIGRQIDSVERRGKYLWLPMTVPGAQADEALLAHLGMSGQFRITDHPLDDHPHLRFDAELVQAELIVAEPRNAEQDASAHGAAPRRWLSFLDQRTFGGLSWEALEPDDSGRLVPERISHIAPDPFEPAFSIDTVVASMRRKRTEIKRALLDQSLVSGIGNIYADEALWRARVHPQRSTDRLASRTTRQVLAAASEVMLEALAVGGTSFDELYVRVNGESGYFERSLNAYGREDEPCRRCGAPIRRLSFMNRSSFVCLRCQRPPRA